MDKTLALGILLTAKDQFSPVFSSFRSSLSNITKDTKNFGTALAGIGTGLKGASLASEGAAKTIISSFVELEDARTQLESTLMKSDGSVSPFFKSINDEAVKLGNALPGTTADFYKMASTLKSLGVEEKSIVGGALKSAAYLGVVLKIPYEEAATATAKFKQALGVTDAELLPFIDDIQRMAHMGVKVGEMSFAFSKVGATMKGLGMVGLKAARDIEPLVGLLIQNGFTGETVGTNLGDIIKRAVGFDGNKKAKKEVNAAGIKLNFNDAGGNFKGTANMIKELEKIKAVKGDAARLSLIESIFGRGEASGMVNVLIAKGTKGIAEFSHTMGIQADINQRAAKASATLANMWESLTGTIQGFTAIIGESLAPEMKGMADWFNNVTSALSEFAKAHPTVTKFVGVAIVGFTAVTGVLGSLAIGIGAFSMALGVLGITSILTFGWIVAGVALVAGAASLIVSNWTPIKSFFSGLWNGVNAKIAGAADFIVTKWTSIKSFFGGLWSGITAGLSTALTVIKNVLSWTPLGVIIENWEVFTPFFNKLFHGIENLISAVWRGIKTIFWWSPLGIIIKNWTPIKSFFSRIFQGIKAVASFAWEGVKALFWWTPLGIIIKNWGKIASVFGSIVGAIKKPFIEFFGWIGEKFAWMADKVGTVAGFFAHNNSSRIGNKIEAFQGTMAAKAQMFAEAHTVSNPRVASAKVATSQAATAQTVTHNTNNVFQIMGGANPETQAREIQKYLDKIARDKKDRGYTS